MKSVDIRYLDIVWNEEQAVLRVDESGQPIELERVGQHWRADTVTYSQKYFYIGVCVTGKLLYEPYIKLANDDAVPLMSIKVPGVDKTWWIQKGSWNKEYKNYGSSIYRTAGHVEISVQNETVILDNHAANFSVADLEYYLSDLKGKLWLLMFDSKSASKANIQKESPSVFSGDVLKLFSGLASSFEAVIKKPHVTLTEFQEKLPKRSVKPVAKTFREIATRSNAKFLTSRSYKETYSTPENRHIHYLAFRSLYLLKTLSRLSSHQVNAMRDKAEQDERWLREQSGRKTKVVDPVVIDNEIQAISLDFEKQRNNLNENVKNELIVSGVQDVNVQTYTVVLGKRYGKSSTENFKYFTKILNGKDFQENYGTYLVFTSCINFAEIFNTEYLGEYHLRVKGSVSKSRKNNSKGKDYFELYFTKIDSIDIVMSPLGQELDRLKNSRERLEENGWVASLGRDELEGISNQSQVARSRLQLVEAALEQLGEFDSHIPFFLSRIKKSVNFFQLHKVRRQQECPNSMVFVQNPVYAAARSLYKKVLNLRGMDESLLNSMMAIDEIGLVNLPNLYERWCLVQLVVVINDIYQFQVQDGWQQKVVSAVLKNGKNVEIIFSCERRQLTLKLIYEKELDSGKRPDYVIDLYYNTYELIDEGGDFSGDTIQPIRWRVKENKIRRIVLDAKFRGDVGEQHITSLITELYEGKNYSEDGSNSVFIIHPVAKVTEARTSPLGWGRYCNYGQADQLDHKKGAVYLSPSREHSYSIENLQRLVGMLLQNHTSILDDGNRRATMWHNKCCISCGRLNLSIVLSATQGGNDVNKIHCNDCGQNTTETVCVSCKRSLYKNGINWTYHRTRAEQTTNVVCPNCETFL